MANRDQYVRSLKTQIDRLNKQAAKLEERARKVQAGYAKQMKQYRVRSAVARAKLARLRHASEGAWKDVARGATGALKRMRSAFGKARLRFSRG